MCVCVYMGNVMCEVVCVCVWLCVCMRVPSADEELHASVTVAVVDTLLVLPRIFAAEANPPSAAGSNENDDMDNGVGPVVAVPAVVVAVVVVLACSCMMRDGVGPTVVVEGLVLCTCTMCRIRKGRRKGGK